MKKLILVTIVVFCVGIIGVTGTKAAEIPLGLLLPYTGVWAWVGAGADPGADLAVAEINEMPPLGMKIKLFKEDTQTQSKPAMEGARKLYDVHKVVGIVGPTSATVRSCIPITKEAGAAEISPTAGTTRWYGLVVHEQVTLQAQGCRYLYRRYRGVTEHLWRVCGCIEGAGNGPRGGGRVCPQSGLIPG